MKRAYYEARAQLCEAEAEVARLCAEVVALDETRSAAQKSDKIREALDIRNGFERQARSYREMALEVQS